MRRTRRRGFTLIEALVAIGAIAIIGVGLASVFESVGQTVTRGRRVREINEIAKRVEEQLRQDIGRMTRDGFLVIRTQVAAPDTTSGEVAQLSPEDLNPRSGNTDDPRPRRVDELMFFAKGEFASARQPLAPGYRATADAACIYYGHGMPYSPDDPALGGDAYWEPRLSDAFSDTPNRSKTKRLVWGTFTSTKPGEGGPSELASDWTLLRHVTLLARPKAAAPFYTDDQIPRRTWPRHFDSRYQIAGQPAAPTIFQSLSPYLPTDYTIREGGREYKLNSENAVATSTLRERLFENNPLGIKNPYPVFSSGLLDIATTSLDEIRRVVLGAPKTPIATWGRGFGGNIPLQDFMLNPTSNAWDLQPTFAPDTTLAPGMPVDLMQRWMIDAFPGNQLRLGADTIPQDHIAAKQFLHATTRMRYEPEPPNDVGVLADTSLSAIDREIALADQQMLSASVFVPRCSEFIVEWSFGDTIPGPPAFPASPHQGEIIWHGLYRQGDWDADGTIRGDIVETTVNPYPWYRVRLGSTASAFRSSYRTVPYTKADGSTGDHQVEQGLIHPELRVGGNVSQMTSCFGYIDPTYAPADGDQPTLEWAWPKLIRITMSLADPDDPTLERTFQFVFEVPDDRVN